MYLALDYAYFNAGIYIDFGKEKSVECFVKAEDTSIYIKKDGKFVPLEIKGVNMGSGTPGEWSTDFAIDKETYKRWFGYIKEMGANTLRIYTIQNDTFYNAFYEYNYNNPDPLYLIHGVWVNDYIQNSHLDAYSKEFYDTFADNSKIMIDVVHGKRKLNIGRVASAGHGTYNKDISQWVIGYILGVEWDDLTVCYTDDLYKNDERYTSYKGKYMYTENATPFEAMLARVGDETIAYETKRYGTQKIVAFSNWPTTDPFVYPKEVTEFFMKCGYVDVEHIKTTDEFLAGQFASYHVYPYYPDYLGAANDWTSLGIQDKSEFVDSQGRLNTYRAYLSMLTKHHSMPVVISEFGVSTGRGMAQIDQNTGRNQGNTSEDDQGKAIEECYEDIKSAGCAGGCIFTWQDEWFKRTWNTMHAVDLKRTPYWSDYQTNEQYFGLLSFDPGEERSVCYADGNIDEWTREDLIIQNDEMALSSKYDEKFIYFMVNKKDLNLESDTIYIPLDITPKSGSNYCENYNLKFDRDVDFIITLNGKDNSRLVCQERYESLRSTYGINVYGFDTYSIGNAPEKNSPLFVKINMMLKTELPPLFMGKSITDGNAEVFETGKLLYGNANPESPDFNSLADFCAGENCVEIKLPWQLLNFADPSRMQIHDDYYDGNYGIEYITIDEIYAGICSGNAGERTILDKIELEGWENKVTYHERLKESYYVVQKMWK